MMALFIIVTFVSAFAIAIGTIAVAVVPQWRRIVRLASGQIEAPAPQVQP